MDAPKLHYVFKISKNEVSNRLKINNRERPAKLPHGLIRLENLLVSKLFSDSCNTTDNTVIKFIIQNIGSFKITYNASYLQ